LHKAKLRIRELLLRTQKEAASPARALDQRVRRQRSRRDGAPWKEAAGFHSQPGVLSTQLQG